MRYVDHDPGLARAAALRCRDAAHTYRRIADVAAAETVQVDWWGRERDQVVEATFVLADDLRREASALEATADRLEQAASAAEARNDDLAEAAAAAVAAAAAAAAAANVCPTGPTVGRPVTSTSSSSTSSTKSGATTAVPKGVW